MVYNISHMSEVVLHEFAYPDDPASFPLPEPIEAVHTDVDIDGQKFVVTTFGNTAEFERVVLDETAYSVDYSSFVEQNRTGRSIALIDEGFGDTIGIGVSLPGFRMGKNGRVSPFTENQLEGLREGDWTPYAETAWKAIDMALALRSGKSDPLSGKSVIYDGHSLGVTTGAAKLATSPDYVRNTHFIGYEGTRWDLPETFSKAKLVGRFAFAGLQLVTELKGLTKENGTEINVLKHGKGNGAVFINGPVLDGLTHASDTQVLTRGVSRPNATDIRVALWYGDRSPLSKEAANRRAASWLAPIIGTENIHLVVGRGEDHQSENYVKRALARKAVFVNHVSGSPLAYSVPVETE
jgi:pimeloyl-ACP methyl ester carboxylesterase